MTVNELIELLKEFDGNATVHIVPRRGIAVQHNVGRVVSGHGNNVWISVAERAGNLSRAMATEVLWTD